MALKKSNRNTDDNCILKTCSVFLFYLIFLVGCASFIFGLNEYPQSGYSSNQYYTDSFTLFNENFVSTYGQPLFYSKVITTNTNYQPALFYDYDSDGINEIITSSNNLIVIFQNKTLQPKATITATNTTIGFYKLFNYSGTPHLVFTAGATAAAQRYIHDYSFNGTAWNLIRAHDTGSNVLSSFNCDETTGNCIVNWLFGNSQSFGYFKLDNTTNMITSASPNSFSANSLLCHPAIPDIIVSDINNDGIRDFSINNAEISTIGGSVFRIYTDIMQINSSNQIQIIYNAISKQPNFNNGATCDGYKYHFSAPLIMDAVPNVINSLVYGAATDTTHFKLYSFYWNVNTLTAYDAHPAVDTSEGIIISNPVRSRVFSGYDNQGYDYCVLGISTGNATIISCGSDRYPTPLLYVDSREYSDVNGSANWLPVTGTAQNTLHAVNSIINLDTEDDYSTDLSEFLTPYGIMKISNSGALCKTIGECSSSINFGIAYSQGILQPAYAKINTPYFDLAFMTTSNIYYIDDRFSNENSRIDAYTIDPCIEQVWLRNTSVSISITPADREFNDVSARVTLYYNSPYAQVSEQSAFFPSGTSINFIFTANQTIQNGYILLETIDSVHNESQYYRTLLIPFSGVSATSGVSFGECQTTATGLVAEYTANATSPAASTITLQKNKLQDLKNEFEPSFGVPFIIFILIFIFCIDVIFLVAFIHHLQVGVGVIVLIDIFILIGAALLGWISAAFVVTLIVLVLILCVMYLAYIWNKVNAT